MHPKVSKAEIRIFKELQRQGLTSCMVTQKTFVLRQTIPDFWWMKLRKVVYLDGEQAHRGREERDSEIKELMENMGFEVLRISYKAPLTNKRFLEVIEEIKEFIGDVS